MPETSLTFPVGKAGTGGTDWPMSKVKGGLDEKGCITRTRFEAGWKVLIVWQCGLRHSREDIGAIDTAMNGPRSRSEHATAMRDRSRALAATEEGG